MTEERAEHNAALSHPVREGAMLRCTSEAENVAPLLVVNQRLNDIDNEHYEYEHCDPSKTGYYQYRQEEVDDLFVDTGLTSDELKPIVDDEICELYQSLHDHSWSDTASGSLLCIHCRKRAPYPEDDECPECGDAEYTGLIPPEDGGARLVCSRHGILKEVETVGE